MKNLVIATRAALIVAACGMALGCTIPEFPDERYQLSAAEVVDRVQCELRLAMTSSPKTRKRLLQLQGAFQLTLMVETTREANPSLDWIIPVRPPNSFSLAPSLTLADRFTREGTIKFDIVFEKLQNGPCLEPTRPGLMRIYGDFGLVDWLNRSLDYTDSNDRAEAGNLEYYLEFDFKLNVGLTPSFSIVNLSGKAGLATTWTNRHKLSVTIEEIPTLLSAQIVCVANLAGSKPCDQTAIADIQEQIKKGRRGPAEAKLDAATRTRLYQQLNMIELRNALGTARIR